MDVDASRGIIAYSGPDECLYFEPGDEIICRPMTLKEGNERIMRKINPSYFEVRVEPPRPPLRYPWRDLTPGAKAESGQSAIKRPRKSSAVVVFVKMLGEAVVMCLRPLLAFGAFLVQRPVSTRIEPESESFDEKLNPASSTRAAFPKN